MVYTLLLSVIFTPTSVLLYVEHSLKDHPWLVIKRKWCLTFPKPYPFVLLAFFPCVFKEEEYRSTSHFPHKIFPTNSTEFQMLGCKSGFSKMSQRFQQSARPEHISISVSLKSSDLQPWNGRSNFTVYSIRHWWLQLNMWSPYGILSPILSLYII